MGFIFCCARFEKSNPASSLQDIKTSSRIGMRSFLFCVQMFKQPFSRIVFDVFPNFIVILLVANDVVIIGALKNSIAFRCCEIDLFCDLIFVPAHYISQCRGRVPRPFRRLYHTNRKEKSVLITLSILLLFWCHL